MPKEELLQKVEELHKEAREMRYCESRIKAGQIAKVIWLIQHLGDLEID